MHLDPTATYSVAVQFGATDSSITTPGAPPFGESPRVLRVGTTMFAGVPGAVVADWLACNEILLPNPDPATGFTWVSLYGARVKVTRDEPASGQPA